MAGQQTPQKSQTILMTLRPIPSPPTSLIAFCPFPASVAVMAAGDNDFQLGDIPPRQPALDAKVTGALI
jgi:hypothetical protein